MHGRAGEREARAWRGEQGEAGWAVYTAVPGMHGIDYD